MTQNNIKKDPEETLPQEKKRWWQYRKMGRKEYGKTALLGLLGYLLCYSFLREGWITGMFAFVSLFCGIIWIVKTIQIEIKKEKIKVENY